MFQRLPYCGYILSQVRIYIFLIVIKLLFFNICFYVYIVFCRTPVASCEMGSYMNLINKQTYSIPKTECDFSPTGLLLGVRQAHFFQRLIGWECAVGNEQKRAGIWEEATLNTARFGEKHKPSPWLRKAASAGMQNAERNKQDHLGQCNETKWWMLLSVAQWTRDTCLLLRCSIATSLLSIISMII